MSNHHPLLGSLRLAWEARYRYTLSVERERHNRYGHVSRLDQARWDELAAARAYFEQSREVDPWCSVCGCIMVDGCVPQCWWISTDPYVCSCHREGK